MNALKEFPRSNTGFKKLVDGSKEMTIFMKKGASDVLLHQTRILLCALHHLQCPRHARTVCLVWHSCFFLLTTDPSRSLFCILSFTDQECPEAASGAPEAPVVLVWRFFISLLVIARTWRSSHSRNYKPLLLPINCTCSFRAC